MEVTSTYSFTSSQNSHQTPPSNPKDPSNPEEWIAHLVLSQTTDPTGWIFKQSKRILKDYAKNGILLESQKKKVSSILSQKGFRTHTNDPRFRGLPVCPTKLLLFSPKLYEILFYPEKYPIESTLLNTLSHEAFQILIDTFDEEKLNNIPTEQLVEIIYMIIHSSIPELEQICKNSLNQQLTTRRRIGIKTFYLLATVRDRLSLFSPSLELACCCPMLTSWEATAKEFEFFNQVMTGTKEKELEELSPPELYRLFLLIHEESKISPTRISPTLCSLRLKIFDRLLNHLKSGELNATYSQQLIAKAQDSFDLCKRLKEDQLTIRLGNIKSPISLWSLFPKSDFFQSLIKFRIEQGIPLGQAISLEGLEGVTEESFSLLYNFWMKDKKIDVDSLSVEQLINLLQTADYLQLNIFFDNTRTQIEIAIIEQCDNTQESLIALAGLNVYCPKLKNHVIVWLNHSSFLSIQKIQEDQKDILNVEIKEIPRLEHLQSTLKVLKIILSNHTIKIKSPQSVMTLREWEEGVRPLIYLLYLHCCIELGLVEEQQLLETQILQLNLELEEKEHPYDWEHFQDWGPYDFLTLLCQLPDNISSHVLTSFHYSYFHSPFWQFVRLCAREDTKALQEEMSRFKEMASKPEKILELSAKELPRFLFFFPHAIREFNLEKSSIFSTLLDNLSWMMSKYIKEETLLPYTLVEIIKQVQKFYPQEGHFTKDLKLISDHLQLPIQLLLNNIINIQGFIKILSEVNTGEIFNKIPRQSIEWAFEMIQKASFSNSESTLINLQELKGFSATHLDALQYLQKRGFDINETIKKFAEELSSVVDRLPLEILCAVASWAAVNKNYALMQTCLSHYCQNGLEFSLYHYDFGIGKYTLTSLQAKPLNILEALGTDVKHLEIKINSDSETLEDPWMKITKACPHVEKLYLEITGAVTPLDSLPLTQFSKLRYLKLLAHDSEAWKSLCSLRIPETIEHIHIHIEIHRSQIEEISNYEFFSHLPPKGITLKLTDDSKPTSSPSWWSYLSLAADPVEKLFHQLSHCTELRILGEENFLPPLTYLMTHNQQLESLSLDYYNTCPTVDDLQKLKNGLPKLKKFDIEWGYNSKLERSRIDDLIKFLKEWKEQSKGITEITWHT